MISEVDYDDLDEDYGFGGSGDILDLPSLYGQEAGQPSQAISQWVEKANTPQYAGWFAGGVLAWKSSFDVTSPSCHRSQGCHSLRRIPLGYWGSGRRTLCL